MNKFEFSDVSGLQHGDEGKGKVIAHFLANNDYVLSIRYNGGGNAGHTIYKDGQKVVFHHFPIGCLYGIRSIIGAGCLIDPIKAEAELVELEKNGVNREDIMIDYRAHIIQPDAINDDIVNDKIGSTGSGIGPTHSRKALKTGIRVETISRTMFLGCRVIDTYQYLLELSQALPGDKKRKVLLEGAQGVLLDPDIGTYPYCTSGCCTIGAISSVGINVHRVKYRYGICKLYHTYVGKMKFQPDDSRLQKLQVAGNEYGATTGRMRQCNWLNLPMLVRALEVQGTTDLIFNKVDIFETVEKPCLIGDKGLIEFSSPLQVVEYLEQYLRCHGYNGSITYSRSPYHI
jgi:adenylosuccinate synthase